MDKWKESKTLRKIIFVGTKTKVLRSSRNGEQIRLPLSDEINVLGMVLIRTIVILVLNSAGFISHRFSRVE